MVGFLYQRFKLFKPKPEGVDDDFKLPELPLDNNPKQSMRSSEKKKSKKWFNCCGSLCKKSKKDKSRRKTVTYKEGGDYEGEDYYMSMMPDNFAIYAGVTSMTSIES